MKNSRFQQVMKAMDQIVFYVATDLWIFGYTHESKDFMIETTRLICNPRGYDAEKENEDGVNPNLVVEV